MSYRPVPAVFYSSEGVHLDSDITGPAILFVKPKDPMYAKKGVSATCNAPKENITPNDRMVTGSPEPLEKNPSLREIVNVGDGLAKKCRPELSVARRVH